MCGAAAPADKPARKSRTRPNGAGNAYRRGRTWTARIVADWKIENGKALPIWRTKGGFKTKRDALEYCQVLKTGKPKAAALTLASYWQAYENGEFAQLSKSKQVAYRGAWKKLSALHHRKMDTFTVKDLREAVSAVAPTFYTARDCKTVLTRLFELAGADGTASRDLPSYIVLPKLKETERETFTKEEQSSLWKLYETGDLRAAIPLLMICTGMMPGEAMGLRVEHIDLEAQKITGAGMKTEVRKKRPYTYRKTQSRLSKI